MDQHAIAPREKWGLVPLRFAVGVTFLMHGGQKFFVFGLSGTADIMGNRVVRLYDVGVAGLHRLLSKLDLILSAQVLIVVAGMEGALPSVVAGLVSRPVIAVPTSVGYGAAFQGIAPLLTMLNSCAAGVTVVNIDNGFGAAMAAARILHS